VSCTCPALPPAFVSQGPQQVARRLTPEQGQGGVSGWVAARGSTCRDYPTRSKPGMACASRGGWARVGTNGATEQDCGRFRMPPLCQFGPLQTLFASES